MKRIIFLFGVLLSFIQLHSQEQIDFNGKILGSGGFVYNVNVVNKKLYKGTVSDFGGNFSLPVSKNDTITFTCIGYKPFRFVIPDTISGDNYRVIVQLKEDTILIGETVITPWPLRKDFSKAFLDEKPKSEKESIAYYAGFREIDGEPIPPKPTILNPVSFIANLLSPKRIREKKMDRIRKILQED